ncbi:hypothetical protein DFH94DRAFT_274708 [Russula ochroleuca]|uniref:Uncharacterized protein n=1 Tax=Russula ochroleuca TaxID=152965 RepID=A0A9P5TD21_9AGAM|nr:hypothetical protein DFH94DRAFT_274708 [Russula ochroleuca]
MEDRVELVTDVEVTTPTIEEARRSLHPCNSPLVASILPSWRSLRPDSEAPPDTLSSKGLMSWLKDLCQRATRAVYVHHPSPLLKAVISEYPVLSRTTNMRAKCQTYLNRTGSHPCQIDGGKLGHIAQYVAEVLWPTSRPAFPLEEPRFSGSDEISTEDSIGTPQDRFSICRSYMHECLHWEFIRNREVSYDRRARGEKHYNTHVSAQSRIERVSTP